MAVPVWLYIPNLIGYVRVILSFFSFAVFFDYPVLFSIAYMTSFLLDAADGFAARHYKQCSRFGAVLDMVTDRFSTAGLVMLLSHLQPYSVPYIRYLLVSMNALDLVSHYTQMYASLAGGKQSHKGASNPLLRIYYTSRLVLSLVCLGQECFYFLMYVRVFAGALGLAHYMGLVDLLLYATLPVYVLKQILNIIQLAEAASNIVALDTTSR